MGKGPDFIKKISILVAPPVALALFLNTFISISLPEFPVRDIMLSMVAAFVLFMLVLHKKESIQLSFQKSFLVLTTLLITVFFIIIGLQGWQIPLILGRNALSVVLTTLGVAILGASFFVFIEPRYFFRRVFDHQGEMLFALILGTCLLVNYVVEHFLWNLMADTTFGVIRGYLEMLGYELRPDSHPQALNHPLYRIRVGRLCSGFDGIFLFVLVYTAFLILDWKKYKPLTIALTYVAGILYMIMLNVMRIILLFMLLIWLIERFGYSHAGNVIVWIFHSNIGWLLYMIGIGLFFAAMLWLEHRSKPT